MCEQLTNMIRIKYFRELILVSVYVLGILGIVASGGGGGGGDASDGEEDTITINMSPLRIVGFGDDNDSGGFAGPPLYPLVFLGDIPSGETILIRARDPYGVGDYYSIIIRNGFGGVSSGMPIATEGEPDNNPMDAATLNWSFFLDRGFDPLFDEDWFTFTSSGECCHYIFTTSNASGPAADPILEIYNPTPNLGPITYKLDSDGIGEETLINGTFDPTNNLTLIGMTQLWEAQLTFTFDRNSFFIVFAGPPVPGNYPVRFAAPPVPDDLPGSVTGSMNIDQYDDVGGRIVGSFDITIFDVSRSTTVGGSFNVTRSPDDPGLLTDFRSQSSRNILLPRINNLKRLFTYMRQK